MEKINCQDWYRVRRGEDDIAWGKCFSLKDATNIMLSQRVMQELSFLDSDVQLKAISKVKNLTNNPIREVAEPFVESGGRWFIKVDDLYVVFSFDLDNIYVSTIRGDIVKDPENRTDSPKPLAFKVSSI